jgi:hypothetical protein
MGWAAEVRFPAGTRDFSLLHSIQWVLVPLSPELKRPGREADHLPPSSDEVKKLVEMYLHSPICLNPLKTEFLLNNVRV